MAQTAINKPIYDAFREAGTSEEKSTLAARAVLPSVDEAATKADVERVESSLKAEIERVETTLKAEIKRLDEKNKANIAELKTDLLRWMAVMMGLTVGAIGVIVNLS